MPEDQKPATPAPKLLATFLESSPANVEEEVTVAGFGVGSMTPTGMRYDVRLPDVQLHCQNDACQGLRFFAPLEQEINFIRHDPRNLFLHYTCRNCRQESKTYAIVLVRSGDKLGRIVKFGEIPPFGPPTPSRVISIIGPDREMFLQGRRAEIQGFGIGAFAYYRRVVENQKSRIIREIAKASAKLGATPEMLDELESAANETQFSRAIDQIKAGIPAALLIEGHNPLTLLHTALSEGLHAHTDQECLQIAQEIRLVLTELAERIANAVKEEAGLKQAVSRLMSRKKTATDNKAADTEVGGARRIGEQ